MKWTEEKVAYLREHYPNETNEAIAKHFGCIPRCIKVKAYKLGLYKSDSYKHKVYSDVVKKQWASYTPEQKKEIIEKRAKLQSVTSKKIYEREIKRSRLCLPPLTKWRLAEKKTYQSARWRLLNVLNYFTEVEGEKSAKVFLYDNDTVRSPKMEKKYEGYFTFKPADDYDKRKTRIVSYNRFIKNNL